MPFRRRLDKTARRNKPLFGSGQELSVIDTSKPISHAATILQFPDTGYLAEDIDYDPQQDSFLFTSILQHAVFRLARNGSCRKFAVSPSSWPVMAIKIDHRQNR